MKVSDILRVKGHSLITVTPDESLALAIQIMSEKDIGSLVVMAHGEIIEQGPHLVEFAHFLWCEFANKHP